MGDILNIAAVHDAGQPKMNVGIRGNRFSLQKSGNVVYLVDASGNRMDFDASLILSDGSSVETRIQDAETQISEMDDLLDHLYGMITTDEYWAALGTDDGFTLIDDATGYPIVDEWTVCDAIDELRTRVCALENLLWDYTATVSDIHSSLNYQEARIYSLELTNRAQTKLIGAVARELSALKSDMASALNHRFLVDDS